MILRVALLAVPLLLAALAASVAASSGAAAQEVGDAAPVDVVIELRVWQNVDDAEDIQLSARPLGGDWGTLGRIPFPLDNVYEVRGHHFIYYYRYGDLTVAGATVRIWQLSDRPEQIWVCAYRCPDRWTPAILNPLEAIPLPLDDGHSPDGRYRYGDLKIATVPGNPGLLSDRVQLLKLRDTLAGAGTLDWDHDTPMTTWTGVSIGGAALRVTKLNLTGSGLTGELSGLLGNLASLEELWLDGNALTGAIPSKLGQLTRLTHVYLAGNALTRCVPPSLHAVPNNDLDSLGLPDCLPPVGTYGDGSRVLSDGSYLLRSGSGRPERPLIFDVPAGIGITIQAVGLHHDNRYWLIVTDAEGASFMRLGLPDYDYWDRVIHPDAPGISAAFDRILESAWIGALDTPSRPVDVPRLTASAGGGAGEILLEWKTASAAGMGWQFRQREPRNDAAWGPWTLIPGSDAGTTSHRLTGFPPEQPYEFEVRPWILGGASYASQASEAFALRIGPDGIPIAVPGTVLEDGRTFRVGDSTYTFTVPIGLTIALVESTFTPDGSTLLKWDQPEGSDYVVLDTALGRYVEADYPYYRWRLYRELAESVREDPLREDSRPVGPIAPAAAIVLLGLVALAAARWRGRV
ncbi:MAG: hypothetical protein F4Z25_03760 [Chloroflexi bacterium]|nr:hypothetical protein [Chloroflexota bacterium]